MESAFDKHMAGFPQSDDIAMMVKAFMGCVR